MSTFFERPKYKLIYVFRINDEAHSGCWKIGETTIGEDIENILSVEPNAEVLTRYAHKRIQQYTSTAGIAYELHHTETAVYETDHRVVAFNDTDVHHVLLRSGVSRKTFGNANITGTEWFVTDLATVRAAITAVKEGRKSLLSTEVSIGHDPIIFRPEQRDAIDKTKKQFRRSSQMLWYAKMRFGKTLCALQVVREMAYGTTLILTHRPVVNDGWYSDFHKIFYDTDHYVYGSKDHGEPLATLLTQHDQGRHIIYFASLQDLRGSEIVGGKFDKNHEVFATAWDLVIIDEAHEGTQTDLATAVLSELRRQKPKELHLSGTPFNLLDKFDDSNTFTWDYTMEQRAKAQWDEEHCGDPNPYAALPRLSIYTYDLGRLLNDYIDDDIAFNFREFFSVDDTGHFRHYDDIQRFLTLLTVTNDDADCYPFANDKYRDTFRHTLWVLPGVAAARALSAMLQTHTVFQHFTIVNVAGDGDDGAERAEALEMVNRAIGADPDATRTITLTCGRLTTGVTVRAWTGVLMLAGSYSTSAAAYMQTIFRVQTPATFNGWTKEDCYAFDFAPDRTLQVLATVPHVDARAGNTTDGQRAALGEFLNFCPVIAMQGSEMRVTMTAERLIQELKRVYINNVVRSGFDDHYLYSAELSKLTDSALAEFDRLKGIIGTTKAMPKTDSIDINRQGLTNEEYAEKESLEKKRNRLTEDEKKRLDELRKKAQVKHNAISILRGISIRMPLLIYGAELSAESDENEQLTIDNFTALIDDESWTEFMPKGVTKAEFDKFKKYYDPDIFTAAAMRIRAMARDADKLSIEQRIERIADIFSHFRNPDKETVLTPWRVVNMHLGETLGGYNFFTDDYSDEVYDYCNPRYIDRGTVTQEVFDNDALLLEINSKTGLYPLYLAYTLYRRRVSELLTSPQTLDQQHQIWDDVVRRNIFVICKTPMARSITRRTLIGFRQATVNTQHVDELVNTIKTHPDTFLSSVIQGHTFWHANTNDNMKFTAIVGNPPYQEVVAQKETANGQKVSVSIFHHFQQVSDQLGKYTSLIYPAVRWIHRSGKGVEQFGMQQINDPHLTKLIFFPDSEDVFKGVGIADGLSIVMKDTRKQEPGFEYTYSKGDSKLTIAAANPGDELFPLNPAEVGISTQLLQAIAKYACLHDAILPRSLFSIESDFVEKNPAAVRPYSDGDLYDPDTEIKLFTNDKAGKAGRARWYVASKDVITTGTEYLDRWKVIVSSANAGGQKRSNQIAIVDDHSAFGRSRIALKTFATRREAENFFAYATSEIIRFAFLLTDESLTSLAYKVPDLGDYTDDNGLIDYAGDVNAQLYKLFSIGTNDQAYIHAVIANRPQ